MKEYVYYVYIMASRRNGTLYIGVTNDLVRRVWEHKNHIFAGFTDRYDVTKLVYYEAFKDVKNAIYQEKRLKNWHRNWKKDLIESMNPDWRDLYDDIIQ